MCVEREKVCPNITSHTTLAEFISCQGNRAKNRAVRMLADLRRISCTSDSPSPDILSQMLQSAKSNLAKLPFFGLRDQFEASQYLFTWTFGLHFHQGITQQLNESLYFNWDSISDTDLASVKTQNAHDLQLYKFGQKLFSERLIYATNEDKKHGKTLFLPTLS